MRMTKVSCECVEACASLVMTNLTVIAGHELPMSKCANCISKNITLYHGHHQPSAWHRMDGVSENLWHSLPLDRTLGGVCKDEEAVGARSYQTRKPKWIQGGRWRIGVRAVGGRIPSRYKTTPSIRATNFLTTRLIEIGW